MKCALELDAALNNLFQSTYLAIDLSVENEK